MGTLHRLTPRNDDPLDQDGEFAVERNAMLYVFRMLRRGRLKTPDFAVYTVLCAVADTGYPATKGYLARRVRRSPRTIYRSIRRLKAVHLVEQQGKHYRATWGPPSCAGAGPRDTRTP